jgi:hypothetical protein
MISFWLSLVIVVIIIYILLCRHSYNKYAVYKLDKKNMKLSPKMTKNELKFLQKVQEEEIKLFNEFSDLCKKYNLQYILAYGTLIGSLQYDGFIPWDDDIDILMTEATIKHLEKIVKDPYYIYKVRPGAFKFKRKEEKYFIDILQLEDHKDSVRDLSNGLYYKKKDLYPLKTGIFEGIQHPIPNNPTNMLDIRYKRNINKLLSTKKRHPPHIREFH